MTSLFDLPFDDPITDPPAPDRVETPALGRPDINVPAPSPEVRRILTVSELTTEIRVLLEETLSDVWVEGELSNCRIWNTGHMYFTLKDTSAQVRGYGDLEPALLGRVEELIDFVTAPQEP